jgi:hypothetical protein
MSKSERQVKPSQKRDNGTAITKAESGQSRRTMYNITIDTSLMKVTATQKT